MTPRDRHLLRLVPVFLVTALGVMTSPAQAAETATQPVVIANAVQYELTSKTNGQSYRLFVYCPPKMEPAKPMPVVYLLDGNWYFSTACDAVPMNQLNGIVVGIGYPSDDRDEVTHRRTFDLSLPNAAGDEKYGGGDAFLKTIDEDIKPFIASKYNVDPAKQALMGHSLGGLMVLRELFRNPQAFSTFVAASPSIWWNSRAVLNDEDAFSQKVKSGDVHARLLITSASDEQYHGDDPDKLAKAKKGVRMIDNASELAARLTALNPTNLIVTREIINDETHRSGSFASICRGLRFVLEVKDEVKK